MSKRQQQRLHAVAVRVGRLNEDEQSTARSPRASLGFSPLRPTKPVSQPRSNTPTPTHVMGARAAATTAVVKAAAVTNAVVKSVAVSSRAVKAVSVKNIAVKNVPVKAAVSAAKGTPVKGTRAPAAAPVKAAVKPAAAAANGSPAKATRVTPAAAKSVAVKCSPAGSVATKAAAEKVRDQGNGRSAGVAVCAAAAGKATLGGVEAAGGRAAGVGSGSGRGGGGASGIPQPGQSRAAHTASQAAAVTGTRIPKPRTTTASGIPKPRPAAPKGSREVEECGQLESGLWGGSRLRMVMDLLHRNLRFARKAGVERGGEEVGTPLALVIHTVFLFNVVP
ncbi:unnamed protein product [Closterium sp. Naga37s-1]|nr:unnamed protein product [Closterium sp. Naga37s-1]